MVIGIQIYSIIAHIQMNMNFRHRGPRQEAILRGNFIQVLFMYLYIFTKSIFLYFKLFNSMCCIYVDCTYTVKFELQYIYIYIYYIYILCINIYIYTQVVLQLSLGLCRLGPHKLSLVKSGQRSISVLNVFQAIIVKVLGRQRQLHALLLVVVVVEGRQEVSQDLEEAPSSHARSWGKQKQAACSQ